MAELSSADRKRLRDRRAQQNLRDKKLRHTTELEARVAHCDLYHNEKSVQKLLEVITGLREQNQALISRQDDLKALVNSWPDISTPPTMLNPWMSGVNATSPDNPGLALQLLRKNQSEKAPNFNSPSHSATTPSSHSSQSLPAASLPINLTWNQLPLHSDVFSDVCNVSLPWLAYPENIYECPDTPSSPLDLLYGSQTNYLANMIHLVMERRPLRDPEKLAMGLLAYYFSKWIMFPSPERFERIPHFMRPNKEQLEVPHPVALDCIPWGKIRSNFIRQWHFYENNREMLFGMFACCIKIRWPWGEKILRRDENNELQIKPEFIEKIMSEDSWGVTPEFVNQYPGLMANIDIDSIIYKLT